jgi:L-aspartate oxidase
METKTADVIIVGAGIAGLMTAFLLSEKKKVIVIAKESLTNCNSHLAQGGIAAVMNHKDHWTAHFEDTVRAGDFHNVEQLTKLLVKNSPQAIALLEGIGVRFDRTTNGDLSLCKEGAHRTPRILHAGGDATGKEIMHRMTEKVKKEAMVIENEMAVDVLKSDKSCVGVWTINKNGKKTAYKAAHTVLATGGSGQLFEVTSNASVATGDGVAIAYRAGAELADLEFFQFHPTMIVQNGISIGLVSEAVRGEGATLETKAGRLLMQNVHPLKDLAPRDVVARELFFAIQQGEEIFLNISCVQNFRQRFPTITALCAKGNIDIQAGKIPVAPGAHFMMGGIKTNRNGQTSIAGLYAVGEVANTGVHGANRLASNSLLEGVVYAKQVAEHILASNKPLRSEVNEYTMALTNLRLPNVKDVKHMMTKNVGIVRNEQGLQKMKKWLEQFVPPIQQNMMLNLNADQIEIVNMVTTAWLITTSALERTESRGAHYRNDFPKKETPWEQQQIVRFRGTEVGHFSCKRKIANILSRRY